MAIDTLSLFKREITQEILDSHIVKTFFSGKEKEVGDKFLLGMLKIDIRDDLEVIIDICELDIQEEIYELTHYVLKGKDSLAYFKLKNSNDFIENLLKEVIQLTNAEEKLEILKKKIDQEIQISNDE